jgi:hypothetical protein
MLVQKSKRLKFSVWKHVMVEYKDQQQMGCTQDVSGHRPCTNHAAVIASLLPAGLLLSLHAQRRQPSVR